MTQLENPMILDRLWHDTPEPDYYSDATWDSIEACIADERLEASILRSAYPFTEFDGDDAVSLLWDDLKKDTASRLINRWLEKNKASFTEIYNAWYRERFGEDDIA